MKEQKKYGVIYADSPWHYKVYSEKGMGRSAEIIWNQENSKADGKYPLD